MTINELNTDLLFEKDMADLQKEFDDAKKELRHDVDVKITLKKIREFIKKWKYFTDNFDISKKRITVIEQKGKAILKYLQGKVNALKKVGTVEKSEIEPLQKYLDDFAEDIDMHVEIQREKYAMARRQR